jgi:hypothetical protein
MEALVLLAALTAINLAAFVLLDLLTGPSSWRRKAGWAALVIGLPLLGPLLCYWRGPPATPRRERRKVGPGDRPGS